MVTYYGPVGEPIKNPTYNYLKKILLTESESYWKQGSGDSCIEIDGCSERIIFFFKEEYGFFIMRHPDYLVLCDDSISIKTITHRVGGEPMQVPTCSFISRSKAFDIIMSLIENKKIPDNVEWIDLYDIEFDYEF